MIWLLISVVLLIVLIFFRIDILLVAPIVSVFLCLVSGLDVVDTLAEGFMPAFATFAKNNFLIFMTSAMFARAMQDTGMAASIARGISSKLGPRFAIPCVFFVSALLTYGGVSLFVVVFVVYPIALQLFKEANITRIIIPGAIAAGAFTWAAFCLPGSPQAGPIVATQNLGTNLMVLPWLGVVCAIFMCAMQLVFMNYLHKSAVKKGLGFEADEKTEALISRLDSMKLPNFFISLVPMLVVLITLNVIGLTVYYSMILGVVVALALAWKNVPNKLTMLNSGAQSAIFALINTCAANGFGGVAKLTPGFAQLVQVFTDPTLMSPLVGLGVATTLIAGACGSGTGGITVALSTMAPVYLDMGVNAGMMHRVASLACCGLDSLPHNGAVVTLLNTCGVDHIATALSQHAMDIAKKYANERITFGKPIAKHQGVMFKFGDMSALISAMELMTYEAAFQKASGQRSTLIAAQAKLFAAINCTQICLECLQVLGGNGYSQDFHVERLVRDAKLLEIGEGTNEVLRMVIGGTVLASN